MKINKIRINSFGKLTNFTLELGDGLNVVFGNNEDGKSTIMAFIKMAFYGTEGKSSDILKNLRKKYFPWNGSPASGSIEFTYNNQSYKLDKLFGATNSSDKTEVMNISTGEKISLGNKTAGEMFFGFSLSTFEKSIFISQPGAFSDNKNEEINARLSNMITTADEEISYDKVKSEIDNKIFAIKSKSGRIGVLDILNKQIQELNDELIKARKIEQQKQELIEQISVKQQDISRIEKAYKDKKAQLENIEKIRKYHSLLTLSSLGEEIELLKNQISDKLNIIKKGSFIADGKFIDENEIRIAEINSLSNNISEYEQRLSKIKTDIDDDNIPDEDLVVKIREDDKKLQILKQELDTLEQKVNTFGRSDLSILEDRIRFAKENFSRIKRQMESEMSRFETTYALEKKPKSTFSFALLILGIIISALSIYLGITKNPLLHYGLVLGVGVFLTPFLLYILKGNPNKKSKEERIEEIKKSYQADLEQAKSELSQSEYEYENTSAQQKQQQETLNQKLIAQKRDYETAQKSLLELIKPYNADSAEQLLNYYMKVQGKINTDKGIKTEIEQNLLQTREKLKSISTQLFDEMGIFTASKDISEIEKALSIIKQSEKEYISLSKELKIKQEMLEKNSRGYSLDKINMAIKQFQQISDNNLLSMENSSEETENKLKLEVSSLFDKLENEKNQFSQMKASLSAEYKEAPKIAVIQKNIEQSIAKANELKKIYTSLTIAAEVLEESHSEMRQNYTPILNQKASNILSQLTDGKYKEIKVNKNLEINIEDNTTGFFREWQYLSTGTIDQAYFAVQLTLSSLFTDENNVQFLDDSFIHYDDKRAELALKFLNDYSKTRQVILFTCRGRETEIGEKYGILHDIR